MVYYYNMKNSGLFFLLQIIIAFLYYLISSIYCNQSIDPGRLQPQCARVAERVFFIQRNNMAQKMRRAREELGQKFLAKTYCCKKVYVLNSIRIVCTRMLESGYSLLQQKYQAAPVVAIIYAWPAAKSLRSLLLWEYPRGSAVLSKVSKSALFFRHVDYYMFSYQ